MADFFKTALSQELLFCIGELLWNNFKTAEQILVIWLSSMVRCICGADNMEQKYCTNCGTQLLYDCEKCKKPTDITQKFCGNCGTKNPYYNTEAYNTHPR
jgi:predicted amidophosphoribosyltransferase